MYEYGFPQQHMTFKGFNGSKRLSDRSQVFDILECKKISAMQPRSWKKSFNNGVIITLKMKRCNECNGGIICVTLNIQVNENNEFEVNLKILKREAPTQFVHMLPYYKL